MTSGHLGSAQQLTLLLRFSIRMVIALVKLKTPVLKARQRRFLFVHRQLVHFTSRYMTIIVLMVVMAAPRQEAMKQPIAF